jgi:hypothetical protein
MSSADDDADAELVARVATFDALLRVHADFRAEPLVIEGAATDWPLLCSGCVLDQLQKLAGDEMVEALSLRYDACGVQCGHATEEMPLRALISRAASAQRRDTSHWYLQWRDLPHPPSTAEPPAADTRAQPAAESASHSADALMRSVRLPAAIEPAHLAQVNAWIGCCRTSHLHFDGLDNLLVVAHGRKEVVLFTPWQLADLYPQLAAEERWKSAARSTLYPHVATDFPRLAQATRRRALLEAGDALWIPAGWWHEVLTPTLCVAFNFWYQAHARSRLRPTLLHLHSDLYARVYARRATARDTEARKREEQGEARAREALEGTGERGTSNKSAVRRKRPRPDPAAEPET